MEVIAVNAHQEITEYIVEMILTNAKQRNLVRMEELVKTFQEVTNVPVKQVIPEETAKRTLMNV